MLTKDSEKVTKSGRYFSEVLAVEIDEPRAYFVRQKIKTNLSDTHISKDIVLKKLRNLKTETEDRKEPLTRPDLSKDT